MIKYNYFQCYLLLLFFILLITLIITLYFNIEYIYTNSTNSINKNTTKYKPLKLIISNEDL